MIDFDAQLEKLKKHAETVHYRENAAQLNALFKSGVKLHPLYDNPKKKYPVFVYNHGGRQTVAPHIDGFGIIPFYKSTGAGGKKDVPADKWYPFFGIGKDAWINKTDGKDVVNYYFSSELGKIAKALDNNIPDLKADHMLFYQSIDIYGEKVPTQKFKDVINRNLNPADSPPDFPETPEGHLQKAYQNWKIPFIKNMYKALDAVHGKSERYPREKYKDILKESDVTFKEIARSLI
jgi:hypothetical protein